VIRSLTTTAMDVIDPDTGDAQGRFEQALRALCAEVDERSQHGGARFRESVMELARALREAGVPIERAVRIVKECLHAAPFWSSIEIYQGHWLREALGYVLDVYYPE
jgi:hypothetical protein